MQFRIVRQKYIHAVFADETRVGEISCARGRWQFHYSAFWVTLPRDQEEEFWKLVNDTKATLNVTTMLLQK